MIITYNEPKLNGEPLRNGNWLDLGTSLCLEKGLYTCIVDFGTTHQRRGVWSIFARIV